METGQNRLRKAVFGVETLPEELPYEERLQNMWGEWQAYVKRIKGGYNVQSVDVLLELLEYYQVKAEDFNRMSREEKERQNPSYNETIRQSYEEE